jgi:hypothetical protein
MGRLEELDEAAIPSLVIAMTSSRECVARAGAKAIRRQLARWETLSVDGAALRQRHLARALADAYPTLSPAARRDAAEIAARLLSHSPAAGSRGNAEFLAACAEVLRADPLQGGHAIGESVRPSHARPALPDRKAPATDQRKPEDMPGLASVSDIPSELTNPRPLKHASAPSPATSIDSTANPLRSPAPTPSAAETTAVALDRSASATSNEPRRLSPIRQAGFDDHSPLEGQAATTPTGKTDLRELARRLNDENSEQAKAASKELQRRGFSVAEVGLARQLLHPDAAVRKKLARALPETVGVDAAPWLMELSRDPDADVRLEAITLMATTGDPAVLEALRKLVAADPDERIQRLSGRLGRVGLLPEKTRANGVSP